MLTHYSELIVNLRRGNIENKIGTNILCSFGGVEDEIMAIAYEEGCANLCIQRAVHTHCFCEFYRLS